MSPRRDFAKKNKSRKDQKRRAKTANSPLWKIVLLTLICMTIGLVYYARHDLEKLHLQKGAVIELTEKPKFEFYSKLPEAPHTQSNPSIQNGVYQIQLASFKNRADADRMKAELILEGYTVQLKPITTADKQTYLRVTVGPYPNLETVHAALEQLRAAQYRGIIHRIG